MFPKQMKRLFICQVSIFESDTSRESKRERESKKEGERGEREERERRERRERGRESEKDGFLHVCAIEIGEGGT